ncbi:MAG: ATP-binding cassette domain-containing protein, partial [Pseudomonadota bacterium]
LAAIRGVLPQAATLAFPFTAIEVVRIGMRDGIDVDQSDRALSALSRVGLAHHAGSFFQELSGGEQQRVQLARVLAQVWEPQRNGVPSWLLLDEPVSSLDIAHQLSVMRIARDYADAGGGVVAVMHDLNLTAMVADHVVLINAGHVVADGPPSDVLTDETLSPVYGCNIRVGLTPSGTAPWFLPHTIEGAPIGG